MSDYEKYYLSVADLIGREEFESRVKEKIKRYDGLIERESAARLVAAELGRNELKIHDISSLRDGKTSLIEGYVDGIGSTKEFTTKNGRSGRVLHISISDESGACRLVLWNRDTGLGEKLREGMKIRIINGKVKNGAYGTEISLGKWSSVWVEVEGEMLQIR